MGCAVSQPHKERKGHEIALRVDIPEKDSEGDTKYVLSFEDERTRDRWASSLRAYAQRGAAPKEPPGAGTGPARR